MKLISKRHPNSFKTGIIGNVVMDIPAISAPYLPLDFKSIQDDIFYSFINVYKVRKAPIRRTFYIDVEKVSPQALASSVHDIQRLVAEGGHLRKKYEEQTAQMILSGYSLEHANNIIAIMKERNITDWTHL